MTMTSPRPQKPQLGEHPQDRVTALLFQVLRELRAELEQRFAAFDVTMGQAFVLIRAWQQPDASPHQLASAAGTDNAAMTRLLDRLEAKGLVARRDHPADRRAILIQLTDAGRALAPKLAPIFGTVEKNLVAGWSEDEVVQVKAALRRLLENLMETRS
jgi:DNA-binding MarR family transcriptional regulator